MDPISLSLLHKGVALAQAGNITRAAEVLREAIRSDETNYEAWRNLGAVLKGLAPPQERIACYRRALEITDDPLTRSNLAAALMEAGEWPQALIEAQAATERLPDDLSAWTNLGHVRTFLGELDAAEHAYRQALRIAPANADALHGLGTLLNAIQRYEEAVQVLGQAQAVRPDDHKIGVVAARARQQVADWSRHAQDVADCVHWVADGRVGLPPFNLLSVPGLSGCQQRRNAATHANAEFASFFPVKSACRTRCNDRLRVGYLTADLRTHVIGRLMGPVLQQSANRHHDVIVYDLWSGANPLQDCLMPHVTAWRDESQASIQDTAQRISADGIDILVDMTGYTGHGRTAVLACRPAPIQVNYLGYPGSLGDRRLADYIITDPLTSPAEHADHYAEALAWLPKSLLPPTSLNAPIPKSSRAQHGLPTDAVVLAAFHNGYKLNPVIFARWMQILASLPDAVLWLLAPTEAMQDRLRAAAQAQGCAAHRLYFYAGGTYAEYLAALSLADLFLDAQPYTAGGTARDALMVGLPMVTALGETFAGRMAASACLAEGVPECVAPSLSDYAPLAIRLGQDEGLRHAIGQKLVAARQTAEGRIQQFAGELDSLYSRMAEQYVAGQPAEPISVALRLDVTDKGKRTMVSAAVEMGGPETKRFLHIGCGLKRKDRTTLGFNSAAWNEVRLDIDASVEPDIVASMLNMSPVADASVDAIFSSHNIEHLYPHEVPVALAEFRRVLAPGGFAVIACPDLRSVCALVAEDKLTEPAYVSAAGPIAPLDILYGYRSALAQGNLFMAHRCGFTQTVLTATLQAAGFASIATRRRPQCFDLWALATASPQPEDTLRALALAHFPE